MGPEIMNSTAGTDQIGRLANMSERFQKSFTEDRIFEARVSFRVLLSSVDEK